MLGRLDAADRAPFLAFGLELAQSSWADSRLYFDRGVTLLQRVHAPVRERYLLLAARVARDHSRSAFQYFEDGAAALGDVGSRFPEDDPAVPRGVSSVILLERTAALLREAGWRVVNVDATIVLQRPRIAERLSAMRANLAAAVGAPPSAVSVKATTEDGLGFTGAGEGASVIAVASITDDPE